MNNVRRYMADPDTIFVGTEGGGLWRTRNGGKSWTALFDQMPTLRIGAVAIAAEQTWLRTAG